MLLALEAREVVSIRRSVAAEVVVAFTRRLAAEVVAFIPHLAAEVAAFTRHSPAIRAEELAGFIRRFTAPADLLLMVSRTPSVMRRIFMAFLHTLCTLMGQPATDSPAMR